MAEEAKLARECRDYVELGLRGQLVKTTIVGRNGWPDDVMLIPGCPVVFIEFKAKGKKPRKNQDRWHKWLTLHGFECWVIDGFYDFVQRIDELMLRGELDAGLR